MEKTPDTITVPSDTNPTLANGAAVDGALIGSLFGDSGKGMAAGGLIGGAVGSVLGKLQMEKEYREGHRVTKPASKSWAMSLNALLTGAIVAFVALTFPISTPTVALIAAGGALLGAWGGARAHDAREREYEAAQNYYIQHGGNYRGREREAQAMNQITAEENALLKWPLMETQGRSYSERAAMRQADTSQQR